MGNNTRIALAVVLGYLLGRQHRLGTALAFGAAAAAGRMSQDPAAVLRLGAELLGKSPVLGQLSELTKPFTAAGKAAAAGAVSKGVDSVSDRIRRRADALRASGQQATPEEPAAAEAAAPEEDEQEDRRRAEDRAPERSGRDEAELADDEAEVTDEYDEGAEEEEGEPEQDEESEAPASQRRPSERSGDRLASAVGLRRKPAQDNLDEGVRRRAPRADRERSNAGSAPVRRRASKP